ncbi:hypothetical protein BJV78DRAFT_153616 [Lactifluus subvellereus]|nr:hypothetical protein BJV78DRAFT_153616 [Lactifluus subvellereus]
MPSTGRGGRGNIRPLSTKHGGDTDPEESLDTRLRYIIPMPGLKEVVSIGRAGARKIRSPLWDAPSRSSGNVSAKSFPIRPEQRGYEHGQDLKTRVDGVHDVSLDSPDCNNAHLSSSSRPQSSRLAHSLGKGKIRNIYVGPAEADIPEEDEPECATHQQLPGVDVYLMHSTGSGGYANVSFGELPSTVGTLHPHGTDHLHEAHIHESETTGRSSAGNISRDHPPESKKLRNRLIATGYSWVRKIQPPSVAEKPRPRSRRVQSTGRGGMGNMRAPSPERKDLPDTRRRRYTIPMSDLNEMVSTGRGRSRTVRSPSLDISRRSNDWGNGNDWSNGKPIPVRPEKRRRGYDRDFKTTIDGVHDTGVNSPGQGSAGNIATRPAAPPRSRFYEQIHSPERGAIGNKHPAEPAENDIQASDRTVYRRGPQGVHSAGRGGSQILPLASHRTSRVLHPCVTPASRTRRTLTSKMTPAQGTHPTMAHHPSARSRVTRVTD